MTRSTRKMREFARLVIACETRENKPTGKQSAATFPDPERLHPQLATFMGVGGFRAMLTRALALASAELPALRVVRVDAQGMLTGLGELHAQVAADKFFEGRVVLLAHLLGLLVAFVGPSMTVELVREVWPTLSANPLDLDEREIA